MMRKYKTLIHNGHMLIWGTKEKYKTCYLLYLYNNSPLLIHVENLMITPLPSMYSLFPQNISEVLFSSFQWLKARKISLRVVTIRFLPNSINLDVLLSIALPFQRGQKSNEFNEAKSFKRNFLIPKIKAVFNKG